MSDRLTIWTAAWENDHRRALFLAQRALAATPVSVPLLQRAAAMLEDVIAHHPAVEAYHVKSLGLMYKNLIGHDAGAVAKVRWAWGEYVARADSSDPQVAPARETLQQLKEGGLADRASAREMLAPARRRVHGGRG